MLHAVQGCENTATELIQRIKSVGGKNFDLAVLERRRAVIGRIRGWRLFENNSHRSSAEACEALSRWNTLLSYLSRRCLSAITIRCGCAPSPIAEADLNEVLFIDGLFSCRGGFRLPGQVLQPQLQPQPPQMNPMDIMNFAMQQFQMMCQQSANCPNLTVYNRQPAGRPMRSVQNRAAIQLQLPSPLDGRSENAAAGAQAEVQDAVAGAGSVLALTDSTPPPPVASAAETEAPPSPILPLNPKLAVSDERDAVNETLKRMLARGKLPAEPAESAAPAAADSPAAAASPKTSKTTPTKGVAGKIIKTPTKTTPGKFIKPSPTKPVRKPPSISWETSRNQVMCRTGASGPGSTHKITFKEAGGGQKSIRIGARKRHCIYMSLPAALPLPSGIAAYT